MSAEARRDERYLDHARRGVGDGTAPSYLSELPLADSLELRL